jgi:hypothetical protein
MILRTIVKPTYTHKIGLGDGNSVDLLEAFDGLKSVMQGYPASLQDDDIVAALKHVGAVQNRSDKATIPVDHWLERGPNAKEYFDRLQQALSEAQGLESRLTATIGQAVWAEEAEMAEDEEPAFGPKI